MIIPIFLSHGSPTILIEKGRYAEFLKRLGRQFKSKGVDIIIVSSPHWVSGDKFLVQISHQLRCIQDYYGFPDELYEFSYDVNNDANFAIDLVKGAIKAGLPVEGTEEWGIDHGAWVLLYFMFPEKDIPVVPISISAYLSPQLHYQWGDFIGRFSRNSERKILFIGSGSTVHRLDKIIWNYKGREIFKQGEKFDEVLLNLIKDGEHEKILSLHESELYHHAMPEGGLRTMFITLGVAGKRARGKVLYHEGQYFGLSIVAIKFNNR